MERERNVRLILISSSGRTYLVLQLTNKIKFNYHTITPTPPPTPISFMCTHFTFQSEEKNQNQRADDLDLNVSHQFVKRLDFLHLSLQDLWRNKKFKKDSLSLPF